MGGGGGGVTVCLGLSTPIVRVNTVISHAFYHAGTC